MNTQSAENWKGFSETVRQLPEDYKFWNWFAGVVDGDGNFDIRIDPISKERVLKQIRIKLHNRDIRILKRIQNYIHIGRIKTIKNKPYSMYIVSTKESMMYIINNIRITVKTISVETIPVEAIGAERMKRPRWHSAERTR